MGQHLCEDGDKNITEQRFTHVDICTLREGSVRKEWAHRDVRPNPKETQKPEPRCHGGVIMLSLFHDGATHWSDHIVRLSFTRKQLIGNDSFAPQMRYAGLTWHGPGRKQPSPGWMTERRVSAGSLFHMSEGCHVWCCLSGRKCMLCKRKPVRRGHHDYDEPKLHTTCSVGGGIQLGSSGRKRFMIAAWPTHADTLHEVAPCRSAAPWVDRAICLPLPCTCAKDILAAARLTHTRHWIHQSMIVTPREVELKNNWVNCRTIWELD